MHLGCGILSRALILNTHLVAVQHGPHDAAEGAGRAALVQRRLDPYHVVQRAYEGGRRGVRACEITGAKGFGARSEPTLPPDKIMAT